MRQLEARHMPQYPLLNYAYNAFCYRSLSFATSVPTKRSTSFRWFPKFPFHTVRPMSDEADYCREEHLLTRHETDSF